MKRFVMLRGIICVIRTDFCSKELEEKKNFIIEIFDLMLIESNV
jgi:hypothetical protein